jgi:hypothetical protein
MQRSSLPPSTGSPDRIPNFDDVKKAKIAECMTVEEFFKPDFLAFQEKILNSEVSSLTSCNTIHQ